MSVYLAVMECKIKITEIVMPPVPGDPHRIFGFYEFKNLKEFKKYLFSKYSVAKSLGYNFPRPPIGQYNEVVYGRLGFEFRDTMTTTKLEFASIANFVKYLEQHSQLAKAIGYVPKTRS